MPELPEIETLVRDLRRTIIGKIIDDVFVGQPKGVNRPLPEFRQLVAGPIYTVDRYGKSAILHLKDGELRLHLGLGGTVRFLRDAPWPSGGFFALHFGDGSQLALDKVFMGHAHYFPSGSQFGQAPDALDPTLSSQRFINILHRKPNFAIKAALMDQAILAGIGNTYSDEILLRAHMNPALRISMLSDDELANLFRTTREVLEGAIAKGGESDWRDFAGQSGGFVDAVHGQKSCGVCGGPVSPITVGSRNGFYCPACQP